MPIAKVRELLKLLHEDGWFLEWQTGSHRRFRHVRKKGTVTVHGHESDSLSRGLVNAILKQAGAAPRVVVERVTVAA